MMLPPLVLCGMRGRVRFLPYVLIPIGAMLLIFREFALPLLIVAAFFLIPGAMMGELYRRDSPARTVLAAGVLTIVGELLFGLLLSYAFQFDPIRELQRMLWDNYHAMPSIMKEQITEDIMDASIRMFLQMIPLFMIASGVYYAVISHVIGHRVLKQYGVPARGFPPVRQWMLPKSLVFYYLIAMFLDLFVPKSYDSIMTTILLNGIPVLTAAFIVQAISFLLFLSHTKRRWATALPVIGIVAAPFLPSVVSLLGVMDVAFPLRKRIQP
jgi:uncharacterized protein YybS (DUF2232 family)